MGVFIYIGKCPSEPYRIVFRTGRDTLLDHIGMFGAHLGVVYSSTRIPTKNTALPGIPPIEHNLEKVYSTKYQAYLLLCIYFPPVPYVRTELGRRSSAFPKELGGACCAFVRIIGEIPREEILIEQEQQTIWDVLHTQCRVKENIRPIFFADLGHFQQPEIVWFLWFLCWTEGVTWQRGFERGVAGLCIWCKLKRRTFEIVCPLFHRLFPHSQPPE